MTLRELVEHPIYKVPLSRTDDDFPQFVTKFLHSYVALLRNIEGPFSDEIKNRHTLIYTLSYRLINSIESYYVGHIPDAYASFKEAALLAKEYLWIDNPNVTIYMDEKNEQMVREYFFKARVSYGKPLDRKEMFIRPFEQRENIPTYRYSIPGLPCLYLSNNILTTWYESGCPDINSLQVSRFELDKSIKRLYFGWNISNFRALTEDVKDTSNNINYLINYITYFPIHALCNIKVQNPQGIFKPEYVFPQFLMQWITEQNIDCIEYMTTKIDYSQFNNTSTFLRFNNLAIPAQTTSQKGYCEILKSRIKLTDSISWQSLQTAYPTLEFPKADKETPPNFFRLFKSIMEIELIKGEKVRYDKTIFGIMEKYLMDNMPVDSIKD